MTAAINIVMVDCQPGLEERYNEWYDNVHIPMCLRYEGMLRVTRCRLLGGPPGQARYLTIYEFRNQEAMLDFPRSPECIAATQEMRQTWRDKDFEIKLAAQYQVIGLFAK